MQVSSNQGILSLIGATFLVKKPVTPFHSQKISNLDNKLYGHPGFNRSSKNDDFGVKK